MCSTLCLHSFCLEWLKGRRQSHSSPASLSGLGVVRCSLLTLCSLRQSSPSCNTLCLKCSNYVSVIQRVWGRWGVCAWVQWRLEEGIRSSRTQSHSACVLGPRSAFPEGCCVHPTSGPTCNSAWKPMLAMHKSLGTFSIYNIILTVLQLDITALVS